MYNNLALKKWWVLFRLDGSSGPMCSYSMDFDNPKSTVILPSPMVLLSQTWDGTPRMIKFDFPTLDFLIIRKQLQEKEWEHRISWNCYDRFLFLVVLFCNSILFDWLNINSRRWRRWKTRDSGTVPIRDWDWKVRVLISLLIMIHLTSSLIIIGKLENWLWSTSSLIIIGPFLGKYYPQRGPTKNNRDHVYDKEFGFKWFIKIAFETCVPIPFDEK